MKKQFETEAIRGQMERSQYLEHSAPIYMTSSFVFEDSEDMRASFAEEKHRNIYSRYSNPNTSELIQKVATMEGVEDGVAFASGMSAIYTTFAALLSSGDHILSCRAVFGSTHTLYTQFFPKWNIEHSYFDPGDFGTLEAELKPNTKILYVESPTNPGVTVLDLERLGDFAKKNNLLFIVDNCFATPYIQQPAKLGAHLVIHSSTKLMDGQGRVLGGITVGSHELIDRIYRFARITGTALSPFNAWILSKSLETLAVRVEAHCKNALTLAEKLEHHPNINWVRYPFLKSHPQHEIAKKQMKLGGSIIAFEVKGGVAAGKRFIDNIKLCSISANLGDTRSIITHPASSTHAKLSSEERLAVEITDGMIRLSVGLEHTDDVWNDLVQALEA
ncbi:MAG: aminotransferase class I/II-fold pyridoxal phosphate-dependent enzyme [Flavobacteriaceae bacterium]|jgi:O-succinylhomoserine sulfhydrylase|nr:aminotransferase class I/II-fold pyridoxal phosphate-dependent enzyme [Flavobacteriaceae bacterium]